MEFDNYPYETTLTELFPNKSLEMIHYVISTVTQGTPMDSAEFKLENMINMLTEAAETTNQNSANPVNNNPFLNDDDGDDDGEGLFDEAVGQNPVLNENELSALFENILSIFPDACPTFVRDLCCPTKKTYVNLDIIVDKMISVDYPKRDFDPSEIYEHLKEMLPNADPSYLHEKANTLTYESAREFKAFVEDAIENENYPTMQDYLKNQKEMDEIKQYTTDFNIDTFLKFFPNPDEFFNNPKRKSALTTNLDENSNQAEETYALNCLYNHYRFLRKRDIEKVLNYYKKDIIKCAAKLDRTLKAMRIPRRYTPEGDIPKNVLLLQEIAYITHKAEIRKVKKMCDETYRRAKAEAKQNGFLQTCNCCFDEELIPEECFFCKNGCIFCKDCVKNGAETMIGEGKLEFPCLADCGSEFNIPTLQMVLDSVVFSRMAQRKQMEEVKHANLDGLETCPFCDFATIPSPEDKVFRCLNIDCMKESCRACRHISHIPLRCNEIEYDEDVQMRTYIENKMTEALLRKCWKCGKVFVKESGCNKMTCSCGAKMCYMCGTAIDDYKHFGENGRCPLWTTDLNKLHAENVLKGVQAAKIALGVDVNPNKLKIDPSKDLAQHYNV